MSRFLRLPSLPPHRLQTLVLILLTLGFTSVVAALGSRQLVAVVDQPAAFINGEPIRLQNPPRIVRGRTMLPLRDSSELLQMPLEAADRRVRLGRATFDLVSLQAWLDGAPQAADSLELIDGQTYVNARLFADALNANIEFADGGRTLTLTALRSRTSNPLAPQARFSTDKNEYAPGERIVYTEYSFDPDGADITARRWSGRQEAFFAPGTYTVGLQVQNSRGAQSTTFTRTITVSGASVDTPTGFALKYSELGETFYDGAVIGYPALTPYGIPTPSMPLLFSDSPETPDRSGLLYQDTIAGSARLLAYHINGLKQNARLYVLARNVEAHPVAVRSVRMGETAPTRIEGTLGQVTLLDYFASSATPQITLKAGQSAAVYVSPSLAPGSGVNLLEDLETSGRVEISFVMLEDGLPATPEVVQQLPVLPMDGKHQRGTFPGAVRKLRVVLTTLPARLVIGDGNFDPVVQGVDALTGTPQRLLGNYGVLYDLEVVGTDGIAVALAPRGGLYRGAMEITEGPLQQAIKLPRSGVLSKPDRPALLWRSSRERLNIRFIPASGSNLPISLVFYRPYATPQEAESRKTYRP